MFERYSEPARRVIFYSQYMANQAGSPEIGIEYLLIGLLRSDMVLARRFLRSPWAAEDFWREIEPQMPVRTGASGNLPLSTETKRALLFAAEEADRFSSKKIGTEHLLLGLLRCEECNATTFLHSAGAGPAATIASSRCLTGTPAATRLRVAQPQFGYR